MLGEVIAEARNFEVVTLIGRFQSGVEPTWKPPAVSILEGTDIISG